MPNEHNQAEGNAYASMPPGYLRVMYPEPEMCLDLATWQEFCGFDMNGSVCEVEIDINSADLTMEVVFKGELPEVQADEKVCTDYFGDRAEGRRVAGPIIGLAGRKVRFSIDPRKLG